MTLPLRPTVGLDDPQQKKRDRETINDILTFRFDDSRVRTAAEISAGITPTNFAYEPLDARRYGLLTAATASANSAALQDAVNVAAAAGGGTVTLPPGSFNTDAPIVVPASVSIRGDDEYETILVKTTSTASSVSDNTLLRYRVTLGYDTQTGNFAAGLVLTGAISGATARIISDLDSGSTGTLTLYKLYGQFQDNETITDTGTGSALVNGAEAEVAVGNPVCVLHFVEGASTGWSGTTSHVRVRGDTASPNTTAVEYGFFFRGMSNGNVHKCVAEFVQVGFFWGQASSIYSEVSSNVALDVWRGFYQHFATSTLMHNNFVARARFSGYYWSAYYSDFSANACDVGGTTWKVGTTEVFRAYEIKSCLGGKVSSNGCESHNGAVWLLNGNTDLAFENNIALEISSDYTGGSDIVALEIQNDIRSTIRGNLCQITGMTGTGARHFTTKIGNLNGKYTYLNNLFVTALNDQTSTATATWPTTSGTIQEEYESGTFTITLTGISGADPTGTARWERHRNMVSLYVPDLSGTSDATTATLTGLPVSIRPGRERRCRINGQDNGISNEVSALVQTSGTIDLFYGPTEAAWTASGTKRIFNNELNYALT